MKKSKRFFAALLAVMLISALTVIPASAAGSDIQPYNNHTDTKFHFRFAGSNWVTPFREKEDESSVYMNCEYADAEYTARVEACKNGGFPSSGKVDVSHGYRYSFETDTVHFMLSWAKEYGDKQKWPTTYAGVVGIPSKTSAYDAIGLWSPDSI